ncbi:hypothetical protein [Rhizohabitans arisaemae]|nr:hypothetical protein [Rhizohabitans arisaemae]
MTGNGHFTLAAVGKRCVSGERTIEATELRTPFKTYTTTVGGPHIP